MSRVIFVALLALLACDGTDNVADPECALTLRIEPRSVVLWAPSNYRFSSNVAAVPSNCAARGPVQWSVDGGYTLTVVDSMAVNVHADIADARGWLRARLARAPEVRDSIWLITTMEVQ